MRRFVQVYYLLLSLVALIAMAGCWFMMIRYGKGPLFPPLRVVNVATIRFNLYWLILYSLIALPTIAICTARFVQLFGEARAEKGAFLKPAAALFACLASLLLATVLAYEQPWRYPIFETDWRAAFQSASGNATDKAEALPSDEELEYPELPLTAPNYYDWSITDLQGKKVPMESFKGKTVFLNLWATWCKFCIKEFPNIQKLQDALKDHPDIAFILLSSEETETIQAWLKDQDYQLPFYTIDKEDWPKHLQVRGYPSTFILAPDGSVAFRHSGACAWDGQRTQNFLKELSTMTITTP